jgi:hypothetical protein
METFASARLSSSRAASFARAVSAHLRVCTTLLIVLLTATDTRVRLGAGWGSGWGLGVGVHANQPQCSWSKSYASGPEVYWINMDKSVERKDNTIRHMTELGYAHHRYSSTHFSVGAMFPVM